MKKIVLILCLVLSQQTWAGNGVERGLIRLPENADLSREVQDYLSRLLGKCVQQSATELFKVSRYQLELDRVDQGIIDEYHSFEIVQLNQAGEVLNQIELKVLDASFSNYRHYDERLSVEKLIDRQSACRLK